MCDRTIFARICLSCHSIVLLKTLCTPRQRSLCVLHTLLDALGIQFGQRHHMISSVLTALSSNEIIREIWHDAQFECYNGVILLDVGTTTL